MALIVLSASLTTLDYCLLGGEDHLEICCRIVAPIVKAFRGLKPFAGIKLKGSFIIMVAVVVFGQQGIFLNWCIPLRFTGRLIELVC